MDVLLVLSLGALSGFIVAQFVSWLGLLWCGPVVAAISAAILHKHGFGGLSGIAITVARLILNQVGYLIASQRSWPEGVSELTGEGMRHPLRERIACVVTG
jgi:hypothetical protein